MKVNTFNTHEQKENHLAELFVRAQKSIIFFVVCRLRNNLFDCELLLNFQKSIDVSNHHTIIHCPVYGLCMFLTLSLKNIHPHLVRNKACSDFQFEAFCTYE